jgi:ectoine hydroxylase-related dioxygenase (phytanoyl-CoA dioxygenase family)
VILEKKIEQFKDEGVILTKDFFKENEISELRNEYDTLDKNLTNQDIYKDKPLIVFWKHVQGEQKRIATFDELPSLWNLIQNKIVPFVKEISKKNQIQLLETIIFNKPYETSNTLHWHQDVAYFPLKPNNQVAVWFPLEPVNKLRGALNYALNSHKEGIKGSTDLHTRKPFENEDRELIPEDPSKSGYEVRCMEMTNKDILMHNGYTWHYSGPNKEKGYTRRGISVRFIIDKAIFDPRPGQGAAFTKQLNLKAGDPFVGDPFPYL